MRKFLIGISFAAIIIAYFFVLKDAVHDAQPVPFYPPVYHGTYQPSNRSNNSLILNTNTQFSNAPQPKIGSVNVNIKQYHVKAAQFRQKLEFQSETRSYSSNGGLHISSNSTVRSYGGGMNGTASHFGMVSANRSNSGAYTNFSNFSVPAQGGIPTLAYSSDNYRLNSWNSTNLTYRASGEFEYQDWVRDYIGIGGGSADLTDNGDGTYNVTESWIAGLYSYLATIGVVGADPRLLQFNTWFGGQTIYLLPGGGTVPPPHINPDDQMPVGDGVMLLFVFAVAYMCYRRTKLSRCKQVVS